MLAWLHACPKVDTSYHYLASVKVHKISLFPDHESSYITLERDVYVAPT